MRYAYARVSTKEQNLDRQIDELNKIENIDFIWQEKQSGKNFQDRVKYQALKNCLKKGDTLIVCSLDRLGRNYDEILEEWNYFKKQGVFIKVLDMPLLDTEQTINGLDGRFIADLVLQILSYVAEKEREKIKQRQEQGIASARARGVKFGRPKKQVDKDKLYYYLSIYESALKKGKMCYPILQQAQQDLSISRGTFYRFLKEFRQC